VYRFTGAGWANGPPNRRNLVTLADKKYHDPLSVAAVSWLKRKVVP
jgi:hypothetical protein